MTGWLRDPTGRFELRYWDGNRWTEHVARGGLQGADPLADAPPMPTAARSPEDLAAAQHDRMRRSSRRWLVVIVGASALMAGLLVAGIVVGDAGPWSGEGGALAERACGKATLAIEDLAAGTRSGASTGAALEDAADDARAAASLNGKWSPLARTIIDARAEVLTASIGRDTRRLVTDCGLDRSGR